MRPKKEGNVFVKPFVPNTARRVGEGSSSFKLQQLLVHAQGNTGL